MITLKTKMLLGQKRSSKSFNLNCFLINFKSKILNYWEEEEELLNTRIEQVQQSSAPLVVKLFYINSGKIHLHQYNKMRLYHCLLHTINVM